MKPLLSESRRIQEFYRKRDRSNVRKLYSIWDPHGLYAVHQREKEVITLLRQNDMEDLSELTILDIGCGNGRQLQRYVDYGASLQNLHGIDLLPERIEKARELNPGISLRCGNADALPYEDQSFDIVTQFTVFTSILDPTMKKRIGKEMLRVLKPGGHILWYDYHRDNPKSTEVLGIRRRDIIRIFPNCLINLKPVTLAPPLARRVSPISWTMANLLQKIPLLCTHYLGIITKCRD